VLRLAEYDNKNEFRKEEMMDVEEETHNDAEMVLSQQVPQ
jgi:hypothetical protein